MGNQDIRPEVKAAAFAAGLAFTLWIAYLARAALFPFLAAFTLAYLLDPVIDRLEKMKINRTTSILFLLAVVFVLFSAMAAFIVPFAVEQVEELGREIPGYVGAAEKRLAPVIAQVADMDREEVAARVREGMKALGDLPQKALKAAATGVWSAMTGAMGLFVALLNLVLIPVATFYLLRDFDLITAAMLRRVPPRHRQKARDVTGRVDAVLSGFFRGQMIVALFMAVILSSGLALIGVPAGFFIGFIAGLCAIVPYLSVFVGLVPALIVSYVGVGDWYQIAMILALFAAANALEGFVISPKTLEKAVGLHPVAVMAALLVGGAFFGFVGLLLAVPAAAVFKVGLQELDAAWMESDLFQDEEKGR